MAHLADAKRFFTTPPTERFFRRMADRVPLWACQNLLDLGSGAAPRNDFLAVNVHGVDFENSSDGRVRAADLSTTPIPFPDGSFGIVTAYDFLEHIPRVVLAQGETKFPFVDLMSEIYRVLAPGGYFFSLTPAFPSGEAFQDPTHVNIISRKTLRLYFCGEEPWARRYGFDGRFDMLTEGWRGHYRFALMKKPPRVQHG